MGKVERSYPMSWRQNVSKGYSTASPRHERSSLLPCCIHILTPKMSLQVLHPPECRMLFASKGNVSLVSSNRQAFLNHHDKKHARHSKQPMSLLHDATDFCMSGTLPDTWLCKLVFALYPHLHLAFHSTRFSQPRRAHHPENDSCGSPQANSWSELSPTGGPPPVREDHTAVWVAADDGFYVFGGTAGSPGPFSVALGCWAKATT